MGEMKKILHFLFGTGWGAAAACAGTGALTMAGLVFGFWGGIWVALFCLTVLAVTVVAMPLAFVWSLFKKRWGNAAAQLVLGLLAAVFCAIGVPAAYIGGWGAAAKWKKPEPWMEIKKPNGVVPFEVEYREWSDYGIGKGYLHYDRRVRFPSGKCVDVASTRLGDGKIDVLSNGEIAVYALDGNSYGLEDGEGNLYRVDIGAERVERGTWNLPLQGMEYMRSQGDGWVAVMADGREEEVREVPPFGPLPAGTRPIGRFCPPGEFVTSEE